jgi:hypothetical protein
LSSKQRGNIESFMKDISDADSSYHMYQKNPSMRFNFPIKANKSYTNRHVDSHKNHDKYHDDVDGQQSSFDFTVG